MKSLQNQYNQILEGKGNKEFFLKAAKEQFPQLITNVFTFNQAVTALHRKGIIVAENKVDNRVDDSQVDWIKVFKENLDGGVKSNLKDTDKQVEEKETTGYNYKDKDLNSNVAPGQFLTGFYTEMKEAKNANKTIEELENLIYKNLKKDPQYYVKGGQFGVKGLGYSDTHPGLGKTKEVTGKYKSSGMEPVKLNEGIGMFHDPTGYDSNRKSQMQLTREILADAGISKEEIGAFISDNMFKPGRLSDRAKEYVSSMKVNPKSLQEDIKAGDKLKHKLTGAEIEITGISGNNITGKYTKLGKMEGKAKIGDTNKTNKNLIGKTYELITKLKNFGPKPKDDKPKGKVSESSHNDSVSHTFEEVEFNGDLYDIEATIKTNSSLEIPASRHPDDPSNMPSEDFTWEIESLDDVKKYNESTESFETVNLPEEIEHKLINFLETNYQSDIHSTDLDETEKRKAPIDKKYTHFAINKANGKIVDGWDYSDVDIYEVKEWASLDLKDNFPHKKLSDFKIVGKTNLLRRGVDPFDSNNWDQLVENKGIQSLVSMLNEVRKEKKQNVHAHVDRIDKLGEVAAWEAKVNLVDERIENLKNKLVVTESDDVKDMIDKSKIKQIKRELAVLEKRKGIYEKKHARARAIADKINKKLGFSDDEAVAEDELAVKTDTVDTKLPTTPTEKTPKVNNPGDVELGESDLEVGEMDLNSEPFDFNAEYTPEEASDLTFDFESEQEATPQSTMSPEQFKNAVFQAAVSDLIQKPVTPVETQKSTLQKILKAKGLGI